MKPSTPIRIDADLYATARRVAPTMSRSTTQQISHWARIGKELESSPEVSVERVAEVLRGAESYDELSGEEQAVVRAFWAERVQTLAGALDFREELTAAGRPYVELDDDGQVIRRDPAAQRPARVERRRSR